MRISDWSSDVCSSDLHSRVRSTDGETATEESLVVEEETVASTTKASDGKKGVRFGDDVDSGNPSSAKKSSRARKGTPHQIGRASCRERVCQYVKISVGAE